MPSDSIPDSRIIKQEILASHERVQQYGLNPSVFRNPEHVHLSAEELALQREKNKEFLEVAKTQIRELYRFVAGAGFVATIVEKDGYILEAIGDSPLIEHLQSVNCCPGYRWTERDVGTSSISLALARKIPVQVNDDEHYCKRGYGHTCSATPVFDENGELVGVISMSGKASQVHPHTLCMLITAARAIENQLRITKTSKTLLLQNDYMNAIIESIDSGVIAVDTNGIITHFNSQAKRILNWHEKLEGKTLSDILGSQVDLNRMMHSGFEFVDREIFLKSKGGVIQLLVTSKPIFDAGQNVIGIIFVFSAIHRIRKLINEMAGSQARFNFEDIIGSSPDIMEAKRLAMLAASGNSTVLILGETGTGKELFAQSIHNLSTRKHHPFVAINCGAIPRELLESELFGYTEGSFTGAKKGGRPGKLELANGGTLFLDEIGDMPVDMQVKFLRVLQTGEMCRIGQHKPISIDLRVIAATHFDLKREVKNGNFREDLFYRLNVLPIHIPPLCERSADILLLAKHILSRCRQVFKKPQIKFSPEAERTLIRYNWPGNVRELENVVERAVNLVDDEFIQPEHFGLQTSEKKNISKKETGGALLEKAEKQTITEVLETMGYNISQAAHTLGISRATLYNKLKKYNYFIPR
jgi:PAS domain S-box-containing protein